MVSAHKEFEGGDVGIEVNWVKGNSGAVGKKGGRGGGGGRDRGDEQELRENRGELSYGFPLSALGQRGRS